MKIQADAKWIARIIAESNDDTQSEIFNELGRIMPLICKEKDEMQICYMVDKFDKYAISFFETVDEFIKIKKEKKDE